MAHNCDGTASRPTFLEHEITAEHILAVCHYEPSDIMLNTVKMHDTAWMLSFLPDPPAVDATILEKAICDACNEELTKWTKY